MSKEPEKLICGCGGKVKIIKAHYTPPMFYAACSQCGIVIYHHATEAEAIAAFKKATRADVVDVLKKEIAELKAECESEPMKCQHRDCKKEATCGTPTKNGYKHLCHTHWAELNPPEEQ